MSTTSDRMSTSAHATPAPEPLPVGTRHVGIAVRRPGGRQARPRPHPAHRRRRGPPHDARAVAVGWSACAASCRPFTPTAPAIPVGAEIIAGCSRCGCSSLFGLGGYRGRIFGAGTDEYKLVINSTLSPPGWWASAATSPSTSSPAGSSSSPSSAGVPLLVLGRFALRPLIKSARRRGVLLHRVVLAGLPSHVDEIAAVLRRESWLGYGSSAHSRRPPTSARSTASGIKVWGNTDDVAWVADTLDADIVFVAAGAFSPRPTCARRSGTSRSTTSRWSWRPRSPTSPASG